ncbi:TPA: antirestriction protein [Escherichia coli]|nr:antirestriction protein [Escherichia coli]
MDSVHHIWCPLFSQEFQDLPDGAETTLTDYALQHPECSAIMRIID